MFANLTDNMLENILGLPTDTANQNADQQQRIETREHNAEQQQRTYTGEQNAEQHQRSENITGQNEISEDDIEIFRHNESIAQTFSLSQEGESRHTPRIDMVLTSPDEAYEFYNNYALIVGFSVKKYGNYHSQRKHRKGEVIRCIYKCNKCGNTPDHTKHQKSERIGVQRSKKNMKIMQDKPTATQKK